jgi:hypothetical protein
MSLITTPFGFASNALDSVAALDLSDMGAVVTGAPSDIGVETARALAQPDATPRRLEHCDER